VVWTIDGTRFVGTGIGSGEGIAISCRSGSNTGIALLGKEPWGYGLVWTYPGRDRSGHRALDAALSPRGAGRFRLESARRLRHRSGVTASAATLLE
jgi:hypothetical protein